MLRLFLVMIVIILALFAYYASEKEPTVKIPVRRITSDNAFTTFTDAASLIAEKEHLSGLNLNLANTRTKESLISKNRHALTKVREGMLLNYEEPPIRSYYDDMSYFSGFRSLYYLLIAEGDVHKDNSRIRQAAYCYLDALKFGNMINNGANLHGFIIGLDMQRSAQSKLLDLYINKNFYGGNKELAMMIRCSENSNTIVNALEEEKWMRVSSVLEVFNEEKNWRLTQAENADSINESIKWLTCNKNKYLNRYIHEMDRTVQRVKQPYSNDSISTPTGLHKELFVDDINEIWLKVNLLDTQKGARKNNCPIC